MRTRGPEMLEAHIRSFDPDAPTARERLEAELGEPFTEQLLRVLLSSAVGEPPSHRVVREGERPTHPTEV